MEDFEPSIIGFLCNWCSYAGADLAGTSRLEIPSNLVPIKVMCSSRVDPESDVCPADIPVADIFIRAGELVQFTLGYNPGADLDEEPPLSVYREHELQDITD